MGRPKSGFAIVDGLREVYGARSDSALAKSLGMYATQIASLRNHQISKTVAKNLVKKIQLAAWRECSGILVDVFQDILSCRNDAQLASKLRFTKPNVSNFRSSDFTPRRVKSFVEKFQSASVSVHDTRLVEFYPVSNLVIDGGSGNFIATKSQNDKALVSELKKRFGVYVFYDSMGELIYVGKAKRTSLFREMSSAFTRTMSEHSVYRTYYPNKRNKAFDFIDRKRKIERSDVRLKDTARYFSVYTMNKTMIDDFEALIIRIAPNNIINVKMEKNALA